MDRKLFPFLSTAWLIIGGMWGCTSPHQYQLFQSEENISTSSPIESLELRGYKYQYKILPEDILAITIWNQWGDMGASFNQSGDIGSGGGKKLEVRVYKNGEIFLPLIGKVRVAGLTEEEAGKKIGKLYRKYLRFPYVKVEDLSKKVYVLGEVKKPGVVPLKKDFTNLIEVISQEGGFTDQARRDSILIISGGEKTTIRKVDLTRLSGLTAQNLFLKPYDIVYVPPVSSKPITLQIGGIQPILNFINSILSTFVNVKTITR
ncbi:MAG: hypothetical protein C6I01_00340 [Epsilonproteobacteria bacterium]|nr:hypothetical protein [Campylobacterota bacterium]NPA88955.1 polysaccharide export protein [Campylobacterota bacterium]